jgi:hypothetical protein
MPVNYEDSDNRSYKGRGIWGISVTNLESFYKSKQIMCRNLQYAWYCTAGYQKAVHVYISNSSMGPS